MSERILSPYLVQNQQVFQEQVQLQMSDTALPLGMSLKHPNIAVYLRCSTEDQDVKSQKTMLEGFMQVQGYAIDECELYIDEGVSAKKHPSFNDRPEGKRLMQDIESKKIDHVFGFKVDRFFRKVSAGSTWLEYMTKKFPLVQIRTTDCFVPTNMASGRQFWHMMLMIAESENESRAERTQGGMQHKQETLQKTSHAVFGWEEYDSGERNITQGRDVGALILLRPNWHEYAVRQWIIEQYGDLTAAKIASKLNGWRIPTATGRNWSSSSIRSQVNRPAKLHDQIHQFEIPSKLIQAPFRTFTTAPRFH